MNLAQTQILRARHDALATYHVDLTPRQQQVLVFRRYGFCDAEIADALGRELNTVRNHLQAARARVVPPGLPISTVTAVDWAWLHGSCCLVALLARVA